MLAWYFTPFPRLLHPGMTFLIAEDNVRMRESIKRFVLGAVPDHHSVFEASDGGAAIELYQRVHPDWVLMDIKMEPVDGLAATRAIKATHPDARIIILTSFDDAGYRRAASDAGTTAYILKDRLVDIIPIISPQPSGDAS